MSASVAEIASAGTVSLLYRLPEPVGDGPMVTPRLVFPAGLTTTQARRLADIGDGLVAGGLEVEALVDASLYQLTPALCESCRCELEGGHCYCCFPVWGYGDKWQATRHHGWNPNKGPLP